MFRILFAIVLILSMSACAGIPDGAPPVGRLTLNGPVTIPPGAAPLRLQYGRPTAFNAVQEQDPFCVFELDTVGEKAQVVEPASFDILAVQFRIEAIAGAQASPFPVMRVSMSLYDDDDGGPSHIYYKTAFRLGPNPQRARNLTCMSNQWMPGIPIMRHLTLSEMRDALGSHFTLDLDGPRQNR
jgi:hypothetical protein